MRSASSSLLWHNQDFTIHLIDIPRSISTAQTTSNASPFGSLLSSEPLLTPFPSNEPKTAASKAKLNSNTVDETLHAEYRELLEHALNEIKSRHSGDWCLPRSVDGGQNPDRPTKRQKLDLSKDGPTSKAKQSSLTESNENAHLLTDLLKKIISERDPSINAVQLPEPCLDCSNDDLRFYSNCSDQPSNLVIRSPTTSQHTPTFNFHLPPGSTFSLSSCADPRPFHAFIRNQAQAHQTRRHFDFILLDPPWPNRSIKRTHRTPNSTYTTAPTLPELRNLLLGTDLDILLADNALVGFWITNKPALRDFLLGPHGVFACWGVELEEEWIWLKTTVDGQPVTALDALWRKPYEVLLIGRRRGFSADVSVSEEGQEEGSGPRKLQRRVLIGVPDLHSRKPCLKELIDEVFFLEREGVRVLEVFARNLVVGWWSWGDECIKFNWEGFWKKDEKG